MPALTETVRDLMSPSYPELATDFDRIQRVAVDEEQAFLRTIASGSKLFDAGRARRPRIRQHGRPGSTAFVLHDTQGFPIDLTLEMAAEAGLTVDTDEFRRLMEEQRERARADAKARKGKFADLSVYRPLLDAGRTEFTGYSELETEATVRGLISRRRAGSRRRTRATRSSWCWTAPRCTPSPAARIPTPHTRYGLYPRQTRRGRGSRSS